jgi:ATP-dependent RNA helicase HelY
VTLAYDFELDDFQQRAVAALHAGESVLVAAPTGSGKTVVADHAVADALARGEKVFYTTPIKALSNQKFGDYVKLHGADRIGLLTGDNAINGDAPVVVMTTEVLRNMIYAASPSLRGLRYVVLDEVHYLQDAYRGPVWEEVIIHLPREVRLVCLSATVSNAEELADWISTVRGPTTAVIEERRPVELRHLYMAGDRTSDRVHLLPTLVDGRPNPEAARLDADAVRGPRRRGRFSSEGRHLFTPHRLEVIDRLGDEGMLPAIYFIFSRAACDDAVKRCVDGGVRLTSPEERGRIRSICEERTASLSDADLDVLGYDRWLVGMEAGVAAHHAGMVPPFKEAVEACFAAGLAKVVFATETLALGINMPARTVVIEKLSKFTGERHELLTPGQYTQLTGRAGRRGIDDLGYAIVLWSPFVTFEQVANLVSTRTFAISSSFRPTYNMAANLVRRYPPDQAHHLLNLSFAQYQADRDIVRLETRLDAVTARLETAQAEIDCERGDAAEYFELQRRLRDLLQSRPSKARDIEAQLAKLRPGDVIRAPGGRNAGPAAVLSSSWRRGGVQVRVLTPRRNRLTLSVQDFDEPPARLGSIEVPDPYQPNSAGFQKEIAQRLGRARLVDDAPVVTDDPRIAELAAEVEHHPVASCPDVDRHRRAWVQSGRVARERSTLERQVKGRSASLARQFDTVLRLLEGWEYLDGWSLTPKGDRLARIYHEADLLIAECLEHGILDVPDAPTLAGIASVFTYESRGPGDQLAPWFPSAEARSRWGEIEALHGRLNDLEERSRLTLTRAPDPGFVGLAHAWAAGEDLGDVLEDEELSGGDFGRNTKQLVDLLRQLGDVAPAPAPARGSAGWCRLRRGSRSMTIRKGEAWGEHAPLPDDGVLVASDAELHHVVEGARRAGLPIPTIGLLGGDLCRTLGGSGDEARLRGEEAITVVCDLGSALVDGRLHWFASSLVARGPWWRGRAFVVMNAAWLGDWNVAPKAHPGDGLLDVFDARVPVSQVLAVRGRMRLGAHLPHPQISTHRAPAAQVELERRMPVWLDGVRIAGARTISVRVEPDALTVVV